jgi:hypothetical protein
MGRQGQCYSDTVITGHKTKVSNPVQPGICQRISNCQKELDAEREALNAKHEEMKQLE